MTKNSIITLVACSVATLGLFGWMFTNDPLPKAASVKDVKSLGSDSVNDASGKVVFNVKRSKATALNNEPVNIVINPGSQTVPKFSGDADLVVRSSGLRMRAEPTSQSELLGKYSRGAKFSHIRDENGWALVQSLDDGQKGWMFKKYMKSPS